jgi:hypothetical protein
VDSSCRDFGFGGGGGEEGVRDKEQGGGGAEGGTGDGRGAAATLGDGLMQTVAVAPGIELGLGLLGDL